MKKLFLVFITTFIGLYAAQAQYFTLRVAGGYAWPGFIKTDGILGPKIDSRSAAVDALVPMVNSDDHDSSYNMLHSSYGQGGNFSFAFGYMVNPYFGVELGVSYLKSSTISVSQQHQMYLPDQTVAGGFTATGAYLNCKISTQAQGLSLMPSLIIKGAKPGWKIYPYARVGISMPVWGTLEHDISIDMDSAFAASSGMRNYVKQSPYFLGAHTAVTLKTEGTVSLGFNGAIGVAYQPLPYLNVFAEVNGQYLNTRGKSTKITKWDADGVSKLKDRGVYRTEFNYTDHLDNHSNNGDFNSNGVDPNKPKDDLRPNAPFSNLGINVGVTILLSKEILKKKKEAK